MKRQILNLKLKKASEKQMILSASLFLTLANGIIILPANAQSLNYDSYLPPEVVPLNPASNYNTPAAANTSNSASSMINNAVAHNASANQSINKPINNISDLQSANQARQSMYNSLMGNNVYPQFAGQTHAVNQPMNLANNQMPNQAMPQMLGNQMNTPGMSNMASSSSSQAQTLSGTVRSSAATQPRTSGGFSHLSSVVTGFGLCGVALAGMRSPGGIYSAGLLGGSMANYGMLNGFRF